MVTFLRRKTFAHSKLGKGRKNKQKWRAPKGRDNKMREKRRGYGAVVSIGYGSDKKVKNTFKEKIPFTVKNIKDLGKMTKENIGMLANVGKKKKIEILQKAKEMKIEFKNVNVEKYLKENLKENKK